MVLMSVPTPPTGRVIRGHFTRGILHEGECYGPEHRDEVVSLPEHVARGYMLRGVFKPDEAPEPEAEETQEEMAPRRARRR